MVDVTQVTRLRSFCNMVKSKSTPKKHYLKRLFGVDRWCTVDEEDESFKLLADLSLCSYFGCGVGKNETDVPRVVSVANSEDSWDDTISDIGDPRRVDGEETVAKGNSLRTTRTTTDPCVTVITLKHEIQPPSPQSHQAAPRHDVPVCEKQYDSERSSRMSTRYEHRETLDSYVAHAPPDVPTARLSKVVHPWDAPRMTYGKRKPKTKRQQESSTAQNYAAHEYPVIFYPKATASNRGAACFYV